MSRPFLQTWLVQRLKPRPPSLLTAAAEQVFGGHNLGLSTEGWALLQKLFGFDYMGAAEYEFGTIPRVLQEMLLDVDQLATFELTLERKDVRENWAKEHRRRMNRQQELQNARRKGVKAPKEKKPELENFKPATLYVLCREAHKEPAREAIKLLALGTTQTKCSNNMARTLDPVPGEEENLVGWLELDNGFFFFRDKYVFDITCAFFKGGAEEKTNATV